MSSVDKYARQLNIIGNECQALLKECQMDEQLTEAERQYITWELTRSTEQLALTTAVLVALSVHSSEI